MIVQFKEVDVEKNCYRHTDTLTCNILTQRVPCTRLGKNMAKTFRLYNYFAAKKQSVVIQNSILVIYVLQIDLGQVLEILGQNFMMHNPHVAKQPTPTTNELAVRVTVDKSRTSSSPQKKRIKNIKGSSMSGYKSQNIFIVFSSKFNCVRALVLKFVVSNQ